MMEFSFEIPCDLEGYVTFECPFCEAEFKLLAGEVQADGQLCNELFCPYCGLTRNADHFYSREVIEHIEALVQNYAFEQINKTMGKMAKSVNKSKVMKMDFKPLKMGNVKELKERDTAEEIFQCKACERREKVIYCVGVSKVFCAYCGVDI